MFLTSATNYKSDEWSGKNWEPECCLAYTPKFENVTRVHKSSVARWKKIYYWLLFTKWRVGLYTTLKRFLFILLFKILMENQSRWWMTKGARETRVIDCSTESQHRSNNCTVLLSMKISEAFPRCCLMRSLLDTMSLWQAFIFRPVFCKRIALLCIGRLFHLFGIGILMMYCRFCLCHPINYPNSCISQ